jgi:hypothetical protein
MVKDGGLSSLCARSHGDFIDSPPARCLRGSARVPADRSVELCRWRVRAHASDASGLYVALVAQSSSAAILDDLCGCATYVLQPTQAAGGARVHHFSL